MIGSVGPRSAVSRGVSNELPGSRNARAQLELMDAVAAPISAWEQFARDLSIALGNLEAELTLEHAAARREELYQALLELRAVAADVADRLAS